MFQDTARDASPVFEFDAHIRYSETDHRGLLTLPSLVNYFQDCSTFQSELLGFSMTMLKEQMKGWVLTHWQIVIDRYPRLCEPVTVGTFAGSFKGISTTRYFYLRDREDKLIAKANSNWVYMDFAKGRALRPDPAQAEAFGIAKPLEMPGEDRRVHVPEKLTPCDPFAVRRDQIDTNEHVNNCEYIQAAIDVLPKMFDPSLLRVDYRRAAVLGDMIHPMMAQDAERSVVSLNDSEGKPFAVIELK